jgi:hypothetical protein
MVWVRAVTVWVRAGTMRGPPQHGLGPSGHDVGPTEHGVGAVAAMSGKHGGNVIAHLIPKGPPGNGGLVHAARVQRALPDWPIKLACRVLEVVHRWWRCLADRSSWTEELP